MSKVEMLKPSPCIYCANVCSSDTLRHCHMLLFHTHEYVFSDVYNAFISARDGKPRQAAENGDNGPPRLDAFIAAFDLKFGEGDVVSSARSSDLLTPDKSPQISVETRLDDAQCADFADTARQPSKSDAHQTKEVAMVSIESTSLMPNIALDRQSTVLWTPSPSPNDAPVACDRLRDADRTPPPPLNLSLSPCTVEQVADASDPCQSPKVAETVEQSVKCDEVGREQPLDGPAVLSTDALHTPKIAALHTPKIAALHTPKIAANVPTPLLAVEPGAAQMTAAETSEDVPVAIKNEVEVPLEKIIKREPEECNQSGIPLRKEAMGELTVIDLTESEEDDVGEFEMTDEIIDMDLETDTEDEIVCVSDSLGSENKQPPQDNKATDRVAEPASALPALPPIDHMKDIEIVFQSKSIDEYKRMVVMKNEEPVEPPKPAGGKARSVFSRLADRSLNCSIESGGGKARSVLSRLGDRTLNCSIEGGGGKRSKPYDRVRKLVKKSIMNCGGNQRTPVKRGGEVCRHTNVYPLGDRPTPQEQPLRVYETNQTDDLLRCNTCKSTKVVRECGLTVLQVARFDEAPRFLLKSNNSGREQRTFSVRAEQHVVRMEQLRNFDTRRRIATSYDWRLSHMQVSLDRQADCFLQNLLHLRTKMSISSDAVVSQANLLGRSLIKQVHDMTENAIARRAVLCIGLRSKQPPRRPPPTDFAPEPPYCPTQSSTSRSTATSQHKQKGKQPSRWSPYKSQQPQWPSTASRNYPMRNGEYMNYTNYPHSRSPPWSQLPYQQQPWWNQAPMMFDYPQASNAQPYFEQQPHHFVPQQFAPQFNYDPMLNLTHSRFRRF